ncbi:hypothetical protein BD626DRAFT_457514 [Schizophyllum amplum]|uniref:Fungal-type protein kinase domain-containing protein n=1 Tax=Schizophyllum amplum TaxID=97359 RepID=A0A550CEN7_9AGAR|nr:hypothetical protein BD626DRAFT_457514 [Auriculariopsis ampla]
MLDVHLRAYEAHVLHRDITEITAMTRRRPDGKALGVLIDWDIACFVDALDFSELTTPQQRIGTGSFMAIDLQQSAANGKISARDHRYFHDLESLFWLLVWAVLHFDLEMKRRRECLLQDWECEWQTAVLYKEGFLTNADAQNRIMNMALEPYDDLVERWIGPLADMFQAARLKSSVRVGKGPKVFNHEMYAKEVTFEKFMATIEVKPREWAPEKK